MIQPFSVAADLAIILRKDDEYLNQICKKEQNLDLESIFLLYQRASVFYVLI